MFVVYLKLEHSIFKISFTKIFIYELFFRKHLDNFIFKLNSKFIPNYTNKLLTYILYLYIKIYTWSK